MNGKCSVHDVPAQFLKPLSERSLTAAVQQHLILSVAMLQQPFFSCIVTHFLNCKYGSSLVTKTECFANQSVSQAIDHNCWDVAAD